MAEAAVLSLRVSDVSGQRTFRASSVPAQSTVAEFVDGLLARLGLARNDPSGRPITYRARHERVGRHLTGGEVIGDALQEDDHVVLHPHISAG